MTSAQIVPALVVPFIVWRVYRRVRRNIGRQPFRPGRMAVGIVFLSLVSAFIAFAALRAPGALAGLGLGLAIGVPLALVGLRLTRFEATPEGKFYTPNTVIGVLVILLLVGRIAYRFVGGAAVTAATGTPAASIGAMLNPITLAIFGVTAGYYITFYAGALIRGRALE